MESLELKSAEIIQSWHDEIEARKSSGMGIKEWCNHRGYPESRYYYHLRMVRRTKKEKEEPSFALLPAPTSEVREGKVTQDKVIVKYREYSVEIPDRFSRQTILAIMEGLKC